MVLHLRGVDGVGLCCGPTPEEVWMGQDCAVVLRRCRWGSIVLRYCN